MADIDSIISGAGGNTRADFSGIPKIADAYYKSRDEAFKQEGRDLFKDGVPRNADGSLDYGAMRDAFFRRGDVATGGALDTLDLRRWRLRYGMDAASQDFPTGAQPTVGPSTSRNSVSADPTKRADAGGGQTPQPQQSPQQAAPQQQPTVMTVLAAQGIPNSELGAAAESIARQIGVDVAQPIDVNDPRVRNVLAPALAQLKRNRVGQVVPEGQSAPQPAPVQQAPGFDERFQGATSSGLVPAGRTPQQQLDLLSRRVASGLLTPEVAKVYETRIKALQDAIAPTPDMKNAAATGKSVEDYQGQADERTTQRDILTKSLIPRIEKSQENASAARNDIDAIHRSREELDRGGTQIFSGPFAEKRLALAKIADVLGVPNADRIEKTEAFSAAIGSRVAAMVKAFGSGTAISDGDRRFAAAMSGGNIELNEGSIRRILDIGERAGGLIIDRHNKQVDKIVGANEALKPARASYIVEAPGAYKKPDASEGVFDAAREAIKKGAPRDAVMKRLRDSGHDPAKL